MASPYKNLKIEENFTRLSKLLINKGTQALKTTLQSLIKPSSLGGKLKDPSTKKLLTSLKFKVIKNEQWDLLYPSIGETDIENFDITLLTVLLRNICCITAPHGGWNELPSSTDSSISANIARIKFYRNKVYGHINTTSVDDNKLKKAPLSTAEANHIEMLKEWYEKERKLIDVTEEIKEDVKVIKRNVAEMEHNMATKADVVEVKEMIQGKICSDLKKHGKCNFNEEFDRLPKWIKIFITSRPELPVQRKLKDMNPVEITTRPRDENNEEDLEKYLKHQLNDRVQEDPYVLWSLARKCEGSFLCAYYAQLSLNKENIELTYENIHQLVPSGLSSVYTKQFKRVKDLTKEIPGNSVISETNFIQFLELLAASREF
ncbi:uncharacterized protein LOC124451963 [Xenia sp. Carnegie-2017]|uniref:uncharacterized protein LOC124451963 n=1 Tax=Xenia sp. Carnegie-2017 TaxID=2897299 RepID=UPI001F045414|nr:uncharacterized protein LOC124451963 [Xenia sp. Carnegie-2017]